MTGLIGSFFREIKGNRFYCDFCTCISINRSRVKLDLSAFRVYIRYIRFGECQLIECMAMGRMIPLIMLVLMMDWT